MEICSGMNKKSQESGREGSLTVRWEVYSHVHREEVVHFPLGFVLRRELLRADLLGLGVPDNNFGLLLLH